MLKDIDDEYCRWESSDSYNYNKRNGSTAHVHMILSYALTRMIDKTECVFFLDSSNSVSVSESVEETSSPWIFHELAMVDNIMIKKPKRPLWGKIIKSIQESRDLKVQYPILGDRLISIDSKVLESWKEGQEFPSDVHPLDNLYSLAPFYKEVL